MARSFWIAAGCVAVGLIPLSALAAGVATPVPTAAPAAAQSDASPVAKAKPQAVAATGTAATQGGALHAVSATTQPLSGTAKVEADHKSAALATVLAFIPGIAFHGTGHMYAGSWMKGLGLFAVEGACVAVGYNAVRITVDQANAQNSASIPTDLSPYYTNAGVALVTGLGFLWTWWDDIAGAGIAADEYNKQQDDAAAMNAAHLQLLPAPGGAMLALSGRF